MRVISVVQNKGGDGKSTVAIMLALYFSLIRGKRTLLFDFDPQCNASSRFLRMEYDEASSGLKDSTWRPPIHPSYDPTSPECEGWDGRSCSADLFLSDDGVEPYPSDQFEKLMIAPGWSSRLDTVERVTSADVKPFVIKKLQSLIELDMMKSMFDFVVIDTPPVLRPITLAALASATDVVIPTQLAQPSINGLFAILLAIEGQRLMRSREINIAGIVPNRVKQQTKRSQEAMANLQKHPKTKPYLLNAFIPEREAIADLCEWGDHSKSAVERQFDSPFSEARGNAPIREIVMAFCEEVEGRLSDGI